MRLSRSSLWVIGLLGLGSVVLYKLRPVDEITGLIALGIIWASLFPAILYLSLRPAPSIPFLPVIGIYYAAFFGLPVFLIALRWPDATSIIMYSRAPLAEIRPVVLLIVLIGILGLVGGFYFARYVLFVKVRQFSLPVVNDGGHQQVLYWILMVSHLLYLYVPGLQNVPSIGHFLGPVGMLSFAGMYLEWRRGRLPNWQAVIVLVLFLTLKLYASIQQLFLTEILLLVGTVFFVFWRERQIKMMFLAVAIATVILLGYSGTTAVRNAAPPGVDRLKVVVTEVYRLFESGETRSKTLYGNQARFGALVHRTGHLWVFHIVADRSPREVNYWAGKTYTPLLTAIVPRIFYPNKPLENIGGEFGRRYGFLPQNHTQTSLNMAWITELLANFGGLGVMLGMPIFGIFLGFVDRALNGSKLSDSAFLVSLAILLPLTYQDSNFSLVVGTLPLLFVSLWVYFVFGCKFLSWRSQRFGGKP